MLDISVQSAYIVCSTPLNWNFSTDYDQLCILTKTFYERMPFKPSACIE